MAATGIMAAHLDAVPLDGPAAHARDAQPWPPARRAWIAVWLLAISLMFMQVDQGVIGFLVAPIKRDFHLSDVEVSYLMGLASVIVYAFIGIPMGRLVDRYPRNIVLSIGVFGIGLATCLCGIAQTFWTFFACRMLVGASGSANGPGSYSMIADLFPPEKLPRAIAVIQIGFTMGLGASLVIGGQLVQLALGWGDMVLPGIGVIRSWQYVFLFAGLPSLVMALLIRLIPEPTRRGLVSAAQQSLPLGQIAREFWRLRGVYVPMFLGLALTSMVVFGVGAWRTAFIQRAYGWAPGKIGLWSGIATLAGSWIGIAIGTRMTEWLGKRHTDAPLRTVAILTALCAPFFAVSTLMPTAELCILTSAFAAAFGIGSAVPQNVAIQIITPNQMRGQITALYLFIFTVIGIGLGPNLITAVSAALGGEAQLGPAMALAGAVMVPLAAVVLALGMRHYRAEIEAREGAGLI